MDARTRKHQPVDHEDEAAARAEPITAKSDRLLASLTLIGGIGVLVALPFALRAGAEFFMPVTAALVIAIALVPLLEWFERRGIPSKAAAGLCVVIFLSIAIFAIGSIVVPASDWVAQMPTKITKVRDALEPVFDLYKNLDRFVGRIANQIEVNQASHARTVTVEQPSSFVGLLSNVRPASPDPAVLRPPRDLLLSRRLDRDAEEDDRQPWQLRGRAHHRPSDPAGG